MTKARVFGAIVAALLAGETGQGPAAASIANAITNATGKRLRDLPLTRKRIKGAIDDMNARPHPPIFKTSSRE